jgi:hypothetical protein
MNSSSEHCTSTRRRSFLSLNQNLTVRSSIQVMRRCAMGGRLCWPNSESQDQQLTDGGGEGFFEHQVRHVKSATPRSLLPAFGHPESIRSGDRYRKVLGLYLERPFHDR